MKFESDFFFAYGTMLKGFSRYHLLVGADAEFIGRATTPGILYDLGDFPGFLAAEDRDDIVMGELYRLPNPAESFPILDDEEGYDTQDSHTSLFVRVTINATPNDGRPVEAWTYRYNRPVGSAIRIPRGDYRAIRETLIER